MNMKEPLSKQISVNKKRFEEAFANCDDIKRQEMRLGKNREVECYVVYIEVAVSNMMLADSVLGKFLNEMWGKEKDEIYKDIQENGLGISDLKELPNLEEVATGIFAGDAVIFVDGYQKALKISGKGYPNMGITKPESERVIRGSKEGFSDSVKANSSLIRKRIRSNGLKIKQKVVGVRSKTLINLVYMEELIRPELLEEIERRLEDFEIDGVLDSGVLEQLTEDSWYSPFPQFQTTERPDKAASAVLDGRIVLSSDNSPTALLLPTNYNCFFQTEDDYNNRWEVSSLLRLIRYIAAFLAMTVPGIYLAVVNFHSQILPTDLVLSFQAAREGVPFTSLIEVMIMEISFELIKEAGVRIPGSFGNTIGIVGGLVIGQAAVEANLASPVVVIVVALTALCSFAVPNEELSSAFRLLKFFLIILCAFLGFYGFVLGLLMILIHLSHLKSFGIPYLMPFVGADLTGYQDERDSLIREPLFRLNRRPIFTNENQKVRMQYRKKKGGKR